jgi:diguanylate cyclase (GGDEF)-like protein
VDGGKVEGAILVMDSRTNFFTFDDYKLLEILAQHMNLAMTNASLHAEVERLVVIDNLTGLYNRKYLYDYVTESQATDEYGSLILIDIDFFKNVNDTYGHQVGDEILVQVADILHDSIRSSDVATRWGGEELAIYLPRVKIDKALDVAERIRKRVMDRTKPQITISSGLSFWDRSDRYISVENLFQCADAALYQAKSVGRNKIIVASMDND